MKNMLDDTGINKLIERTMQLQSSSKARWGNMTVSTMLYHCNLINNNILTNKITRPALVKERVMKLVFRVMKQLPKGIQTGSRFLPQLQDDLNFEQEHTAFIQSVSNFKNQTITLVGLHPFFGPLNTIEWRRFVWMHIDHHLRQFNV